MMSELIARIAELGMGLAYGYLAVGLNHVD